MATLTSSYQYLGRSSAMKSQNGSYSYYILLYGKTSANQTTGIHTVTIKEVLASINSGVTYYQYTTEYNGKINNTVAFSGTNKPSAAWNKTNLVEGGVTYKTWTVIGEGSVNVDCTNGLAKDITLSCYYKFNHSGATYTPSKGANVTASVTATLSAIPRQATLLTAPNFSDGSNPTITYSNPSGNAVTSLEAAIYNNSGMQSYAPYRAISTTGTSYTFNLTTAERNNLLNACQGGNSLPVRFYIRTVIGGVTYVSDPIERTFSIEDADPIITASVIDTNEKTVALTGNNEMLVRYCSNATATMSAEAQKGAAIDENLYIIRNGSRTGYGKTHTFDNVEYGVFDFIAEDSRGNIGVRSLMTPMIDYVKLTCNIASNRPDALGNMTVVCNGDFFNGSFGATSNTLTVQYRYTIYGNAFSDNWEYMTVTKNGNTYYATANFTIPDFNQNLYYSFETRAIDKITTISSTESAVKSTPIFHWGENDFVFEVPVEFKAGASGASMGNKVEGDLNVTGNLRLKGDGNFGNTLLLGDGTYCYITEPADDEMTIKARRIDLSADGGVCVNGNTLPILKYGTWTPKINLSTVSSYTTQYGWYSKSNQAVTIGFYIKVTCRSGYESVDISITGLPFTPLFSAAGGGMCAGAYVNAGQNFQCFVAETSGKITARTQSCNHTISGNLITSASGCKYPNGGGELTVSGTITYMSTT